MATVNPIKAAQLRALAMEESAKKATAPVAKPAAVAKAPVVVKTEKGAPTGSRISIADVKEVRKPIPGVQLKKVVDYLRNVRREVGTEELHRETGVQADDDLRFSLEQNPKVSITPDGKYRFKPKFDIRNRDELLDAIDKYDDGISMQELEDCYVGIKEDAKALAEEKKIYVLLNTDTKQDVLFPTEPTLRVDVSKDFQDVWKKLTDNFPPESEMEAKMIAVGLKPTKQAVQQKIARTQEEEPKKKKVKKNLKIHNTHIAGYAQSAKEFDPAAAQAAAQAKKGGL